MLSSSAVLCGGGCDAAMSVAAAGTRRNVSVRRRGDAAMSVCGDISDVI
jgi:hypothetical protein